LLYAWRFDLVLRWLGFLLLGIQYTIILTGISVGAGMVIGLLVATSRMSPSRILRWAAVAYLDVFRSIPPFVLLLWFFYCIPIITGLQLSALVSAGVALALIAGAFLAETIRAGIQSIERGQAEAGMVVGMVPSQVYRRIILPQALVRMLPPLISTVISMTKASALASIVGVAELMWQGNALIQWTFRPVETLTVVAGVYFVLTYPQTLLAEYLYRRLLVKD
jgi:polar amino acid transport system permease protein